MKRNSLDLVPSGFFAFRTPLLPLAELAAWGAGLAAPSAVRDADNESLAEAIENDRRQLRQRLAALLERPEIREALFVASPHLAEGLDAWRADPDGKKGRRAEQSLVRYLARMASRATPFGLFSGCSTGEIAEHTRLVVGPRAAYGRHTRLDQDYLFALGEDLGKDHELRAHLRYTPSTSLYRAAGRLRYAEARVQDRTRSYHLVAVDTSEYLEATLERARSGAGEGGTGEEGRAGEEEGATVAELAQALVDDSLAEDDPDEVIELEEAEGFIHELIDAQLLVAPLAPAVTGREPIYELLERCNQAPPTQEVAKRLTQVRATLDSLDINGLGADPEIYRGVATTLEEMETRVELPRLFQVDMTKPAPDASLGPAVLAELDRAVAVLHQLVGKLPKDSMARFREAFRGRYEDAEVPLIQALDEEVGVGFERSEGTGSDASPLLAGLGFPPQPQDPTVRWGPWMDVLLGKLHGALSGNTNASSADDEVPSIEITEKDWKDLIDEDDLPALPSAFQVMATLAASSADEVDRGNFKLLFRGSAGPSGARLLGRFCHADEALCRHVEKHLKAEEAFLPEAIFAEVVHLPEGRLGNILSRPRLRRYEIPYLGRGAAPPEERIPVDDLLVSVRGDRTILRSRRLGKRVLPRLTSAHNFSHGRNLGVYRFLGHLQAEGIRSGVGWNWGPLESMPFLPRVTCGRLVLNRAQWRASGDEIKPLAKKHGAERFRAVQAWREMRRLPRHVVLADADNELLVDLDNILSIDAFLAVVKNRGQAVLTELFPGPDELMAEGPEGRFVHELVVPYTRQLPKAKDAPPGPRAQQKADVQQDDAQQKADVQQDDAQQKAKAPEKPAPVRRTFTPGSEWLYLKLYTGTSTADQVLRELIGPVARDAIAHGAADSFFFLRYGDPDWHLRVRFHGTPQGLHGQVLPRLLSGAATLSDAGWLHRVQLDTYHRELERYGGAAGIEVCERIFHVDSDAVVAIVENLEGDAGADARWKLALRGSSLLLDDLGLDDSTQLDVLRRMQTSFAREHRVNTPFRKQLSSRLRTDREELEGLLATAPPDDHPLAPGFDILRRRSEQLAPLTEELRRREAAGHLTTSVDDLATSFIHMFNNRLLRSQGRAHEVVLYDYLHQLVRSRAARRQAGKRTKKKTKKS